MPLAYDLDLVVKNPKLLDSATAFNADAINGRFFLRLPRLLRSMLRTVKTMKRARAFALERFQNRSCRPTFSGSSKNALEDLNALSTAQLLTELNDRIQYVMTDFGGESLKPGFFGGIARPRCRTS